MALNRRDFLGLAGALGATSALGGCQPIYRRLSGLPRPLTEWPPADQASFRALGRMTFGPRGEDRLDVTESGLEAWIEGQLQPETVDDGGLGWRLRPLDALRLPADALDAWEPSDVVDQLSQGTLLRQVYSRRQLHEVMVAFWTDHFNISVAKDGVWRLKPVDDREVLRPHAMGRFRDLLWASAHSPAMLVYLDNQANLRAAPNENYARELMELHSLGVDGGYDQEDVMSLARSLTGWTVKQHGWLGEFAFDPEQHEAGTKIVLDRRVDASGIAEAEQVIEGLAEHPATAHHIATKLVRRFVCDDPQRDEPALVDRAATVFLESRGDIRSVLRILLFDGLAKRQDPLPVKLKRPLSFLTSALRQLDADTDGGPPLRRHLIAMGQPPFEWPTPEGPPDTASAWVGGLLPRWRFAHDLMQGAIPGTRVDMDMLLGAAGAEAPAEILGRFSELLIGASLDGELRDDFLAAVLDKGRSSPEDDPEVLAKLTVAGLIASPAFQWS